jgi:hypothetical protein
MCIRSLDQHRLGVPETSLDGHNVPRASLHLGFSQLGRATGTGLQPAAVPKREHG